MHYVYILVCSNNRTYIGCTNNLKNRIKKHSSGEISATRDRLPIRLVSYFAFSNKYTAYNLERYLKSGSGRAFIKKHKLISL